MKKIIRFIYRQPLPVVAMVVVICIVVWAMANRKKGTRFVKAFLWMFCRILFWGGMLTILYATIFGRTRGNVEICLIPFYSLYMAREEPEIYRSMFMNVLLFVPIGMGLPFIMSPNFERKIMKILLCTVIFSFVIEAIQYVAELGRAEVDDIICNTIGTMVGCISYLLSGTCRKINYCKGK